MADTRPSASDFFRDLNKAFDSNKPFYLRQEPRPTTYVTVLEYGTDAEVVREGFDLGLPLGDGLFDLVKRPDGVWELPA